jgi:hypothetical protein
MITSQLVRLEFREPLGSSAGKPHTAHVCSLTLGRSPTESRDEKDGQQEDHSEQCMWLNSS